jgi:hypothetical protein
MATHLIIFHRSGLGEKSPPDCLILTLLDCPLLTSLIAFDIFILPIHQNANMMLDQKGRGYNGIGPTPC